MRPPNGRKSDAARPNLFPPIFVLEKWTNILSGEAVSPGKLEDTAMKKPSEIAAPLRNLSKEDQTSLLVKAGLQIKPRSVRGSSACRFYCHDCGLPRAAIAKLRDLGHGEKIMTGSGANSGRWYFPIEILEMAAREAERRGA